MRLRIDACGRLVIPRAMPDETCITPGAAVAATLRDGRIGCEASATAVLLERRGRAWVAVPEADTPTLRREDVQATVDALRDDAMPYDHA